MLDFDPGGAPLNRLYGDLYKSRDGAFAEARTVFVEGCNLPERWAGRAGYVVLELGFGLGVNFLATLAAWRDAPSRPRRLFFVSIEKHPLPTPDLARALDAVGAPVRDRDALLARWPCPLPGLHDLVFEDGAVHLMLGIGDAAAVVKRLDLAADSFFLDGFAPTNNPAMWTPALVRELARRARRGATLATYSTHPTVISTLADAGFAVERVAGFGGKRHRLRATWAPRWRSFPVPAEAPVWAQRRVAVVGAGLAGRAVAAELAARGWQVELLRAPVDRHAGSAQPAGVEHLHLSPDDNLLARLTRAALLMKRQAASPTGSDPDVAEPPSGKLLLAVDDADAERQRMMVERLAFPDAFVRALDAAEAGDVAGLALAHGALWLPMCGFGPIAAADTSSSSTAAAATHDGRVDRLDRVGDTWRLFDADGRVLADAEVVILANAGDAPRLAGSASIRLTRTLGQTTHLSPQALPGLAAALGGPAYAVPMANGTLIGSTFSEDNDPAPSDAADDSNCRRLARALGWPAARLSSHVVDRFTGFRFTPVDRLPLIGPMPDEARVAADAADLLRNRRLPVPLRPGLYASFGFGSRGLLWAALGAHLLGSMLDGEPMPIESELLRAIAPSRFALRPFTRGVDRSQASHDT